MIEHYLPHDWFSHPIPSNVEIGERSWLYSSFAFQHYRSKASIGVGVGCDTGIYHGSFFDLGPDAVVKIGDFCSLVGVILSTNGKVSIADYCLIAHEVVIADDSWSTPGAHNRDCSPSVECTIDIGPNVWIGARAIILGSLRIGEGTIIGAGSLVTQDVPPFSVWGGNPGRIIRTLRAA